MLAMQKIDFSKHYTPEQLAALRTRIAKMKNRAAAAATWERRRMFNLS